MMMTSLSLLLLLQVVLVGLVSVVQVQGTTTTMTLENAMKPLTKQEQEHGKIGFECLEILLEEHEDLKSTLYELYHEIDDVDNNIIQYQQRHETIYRMYGYDGITIICDITNKLQETRRRRSLRKKQGQEKHQHRQTQTQEEKASSSSSSASSAAYYISSSSCSNTIVQPKYPADPEYDTDGEYNEWASQHVDPYLPDNGNRNSRTDPTKLVSQLQDAIDISLEAEYASMSCYPIFSTIEAVVSIPDAVVLNQGDIVAAISQFVCGFGNRASNAVTTSLYRQLSQARSHDQYINDAEQQAAHMNTANLVSAMCTSASATARESNERLSSMTTRLNKAMNELEDIKRSLVV